MVWKVRKSIFDSWREEGIHQALRYRWSTRFDVYDHQPLLNVLSVDLDDLSPFERSLVKSMSLDFTFTDKSGHPVLSVEYDGMAEGYSTFDGWALLARRFSDASGYQPSRIDVGKDARRPDRMNFKLQAAARAWYPLLVIGTPEVRDISPGVKLSVLDGIIGDYLAGVRMRKEMQGYIDSVNRDTELTHNDVQDLAMDYEIGVRCDENPLCRMEAGIMGDLLKRGRSSGYHYGFRVDYLTPRANQFDPLEPIWEEVPADEKVDLDRIWVGQSWRTNLEGIGIVSTRFANRRISCFGVSTDVLWWEVLDLLHPLHIRQELVNAGKLTPAPCPECGGSHLESEHPIVS